jgi:hydroxymethylbilane synthase
MQSTRIRIGTRGSKLALTQARETRRRLMDAHGFAESQFEIRVIKTSGDLIQDKALRDLGGKGLFTKEIEDALLKGEIDIAVHSMKDVPTRLPAGLEICCILPREDVRDAFISLKARSLEDLPRGAVIGTSSLRRQAQVKRLRPDFRVITYRGNVETRLRKLAEGQADATFLAAAGLRRLGMGGHITALMDTDDMLPAVAQGAIGIEVAQSAALMKALLEPLHHAETAIAVECERAFLARLDGSCRTPIAGLARLVGGELQFAGMILTPDGVCCHEVAREGPLEYAAVMGDDAALELLDLAGPQFFRAVA